MIIYRCDRCDRGSSPDQLYTVTVRCATQPHQPDRPIQEIHSLLGQVCVQCVDRALGDLRAALLAGAVRVGP